MPREKYFQRTLGREEYLSLVEEAIGYAGLEVDPSGILREAEGKAKSPGELGDVLEHAMVSRSLDDPRWLEAAREFLLRRIYLEAGLNPESIVEEERRIGYQGLRLLYARYLLRDHQGRITETPSHMFRRVARFIAKAELMHGASVREAEEWEERFYKLMSELRFLPNSPTMMNSDTSMPQLAACFVVPVHDDTDAIFDAARVSARIQRTGAGVGFDFSELRPRGEYIAGVGGFSSGPVSFMEIFDTAASVLKSGGKRRGAMMGILHAWHPDIEKFIESKCSDKPRFQNFNISVAVYDQFMKAVENKEKWPLINPHKCPAILGSRDILGVAETCGAERLVDAARVFEKIVRCAWRSGDPGLVFIDTVNDHNPTPSLGLIRATNPCGETPLLGWEACNLGSINLGKYIVNGERVDWETLASDVRVAVRLLDDVIDVAWYPDPRIEHAVKRTRKIGLGVMGLADMLAELKVRYDSDDALFLADKVMEWIAYNGKIESIRLAEERGPYPAFWESRHKDGWLNFEPQVPANMIYDEGKVSAKVRRLVEERPPVDWSNVRREMRVKGVRNATVTTIAPTGSISIIAGASSSIEPFYSLAYIRLSTIGRFIEVNKHLSKILMERGLRSRELILRIAEKGGVEGMEEIPGELRSSLRTALEISPEYHVRMQAVFQRWTDNAVSKTVNLRSDEPPETVWRVYMLAWRLGCKGITVYRDKSREDQVLVPGERLEEFLEGRHRRVRHGDAIRPRTVRISEKEFHAAVEEYSGGCPKCDI